jgi:diadenosine tetraphosphate (Ap4A) HIT family hydrolase
MSTCAICDRIRQITTKGNPALVYEFPKSYLLLGDHQYFPGYCVLIYKEHVRELHELPAGDAQELNAELMQATKAIAKSFQPWKINHACLGNRDQHIHWHIIPRYETEADHQFDPWKHAEEFQHFTVNEDQKLELADLIRSNIPNP